MIELSLQIKLLIFSFSFGFLFSAFLEWFNKVTYNKKNYIKIVLSFLIVTSFSIIYFIGIQKIGNAILHVYSLISIVVGFIVYDFIIKIIANNNKKWYTYYGDSMAKRRISKASKRRLTVFGSLSIVVVIYFSFSLIYNIYTIFSLNMEKKNLENKYVQLQEEADNLKSEISKLNDENYLANYAREHYLYSKNGEYILKIEDDIVFIPIYMTGLL